MADRPKSHRRHPPFGVENDGTYIEAEFAGGGRSRRRAGRYGVSVMGRPLHDHRGGRPAPNFLWVKLMQDYFVPEVDRRLEAAGGEDVNAWLVREGWAMAYGR